MGSHLCRTYTTEQLRQVQAFYFHSYIMVLLRHCEITNCLVDHTKKSKVSLQRLLV